MLIFLLEVFLFLFFPLYVVVVYILSVALLFS